MDFHVTCTGMSQGAPSDPCIIVIFGASGDLARTTLVPSLFALYQHGLMPSPFAIIGFARREWDDQSYRNEMYQYASEEKAIDAAAWQEFSQSLFYVGGNFNDPAAGAYSQLAARIAELQAERNISPNILCHLSTAPGFYAEIMQKLHDAKLLSEEGGWRRVIVEKPFGHDEQSARDLDQKLLEVIEEDRLYRVDHFLGKETVQNMLVFRFSNPGFEAIWNHHYVDHVQITVAENEGIGTRAGYYDTSGVVRDMLQNHLLQLLCMAAMEPPIYYDGRSLRDETVKVLQAIRPINPALHTVVGQYGCDKDGKFPAYRDEEDVPKDSNACTYVAVKLNIDNWRWSGVPFYLRTGKRMARKVSTISIHFKPTPHLMFPVDDPAHLQNNVLTFRLQPDESIVHTFLAKQPGPDISLQPVTMTFRYDAAFGIEQAPGAYQWLLHDAMHGDQTLFARSDWIYRAWHVVEPILEYLDQRSTHPLPLYPSGSWGPERSAELLALDGRKWFVQPEYD